MRAGARIRGIVRSSMSVDTRGALGAEAPIFSGSILNTIIIYTGIVKIVGLGPKHKLMIVA